MASIDLMTFDQAAYTPGELVTLTVDYTPDVGSQTFTATAVITDAAGAQVATSSAPFVVNTPAGDVVGVTDDGGHVWAQASDTGTVAVFTTTA